MNKKAEINRLRAIVFKGAPEWAKWAAMSSKSIWFYYENKPVNTHPKFDLTGWFHRFGWIVAKNQPETDLDWTETLLRR